MANFTVDNYDIIVVGAGHAGCEAALAAARLGKKTLCLAINLDSVAMMPCNPSIGGTGKGHLVREIDALGGAMGSVIDQTLIQSRMLNVGKGPAVHSLRAQADKRHYHDVMKQMLERQANLDLIEDEVTALIIEDGQVKGVVTVNQCSYGGRAVVLATGTYLAAKIFIGDVVKQSGPSGMAPSLPFADYLRAAGFAMRRFKTGTPARVNRQSIDFSAMAIQHGDSQIVPFSFMTDRIDIEQVPCYLTYTNEQTHRIILDNIEKSAMYSGNIEGVGPRYCPSIEDKVVRFADRSRHQIFIEPEGLKTDEMYIQGMSSSLPLSVQIDFLRSVKGLENCQIMRPAHAIEYDCIDPLSLKPTLELKAVGGLYAAGQINGSSGYEEAAAQGLIAGINAARQLDALPPVVLDRAQAYIGVLIDDLVTKGTNEPYRIMTGRCEYRLLLRQDNADERLTPLGYQIGLASAARYQKYCAKAAAIEREMARLKDTKIKVEQINPLLLELGLNEVTMSLTLYDLLRRPEFDYAVLARVDAARPALAEDIVKQCEINIKYQGYIQKQIEQVAKFKRMEQRVLPDDIDYQKIDSLRNEAKQKLTDIRPRSIGQASRISGVSPADISVLLVYLEQRKRQC